MDRVEDGLLFGADVGGEPLSGVIDGGGCRAQGVELLDDVGNVESCPVLDRAGGARAVNTIVRCASMASRCGGTWARLVSLSCASGMTARRAKGRDRSR